MTTPTPRNGRGQRTTDLAQIETDNTAARLYGTGLSYRQIAERLNVDVSTAHGRVQRALERAANREDILTIKAERLAELAEMRVQAWKVLRTEHLTVNQGRVVKHPDTGAPLLDDGPVLAAVGMLLRVQEREAKLLGLDRADEVAERSAAALEALSVAVELAVRAALVAAGVAADHGPSIAAARSALRVIEG